MISSAQIRAARSLLGFSQAQVSEVAGISIPTLKRAEGSGAISASKSAMASIATALETAGIEFIAENSGGSGVRLKTPTE